MFAIGVRRDSNNTALVFYGVIFSFLGVCFVFRGFCASQVLRKINLLNEDCSTPTYHCFLSINLSAGGRLCDRMMNEGSDWGMQKMPEKLKHPKVVMIQFFFKIMICWLG